MLDQRDHESQNMLVLFHNGNSGVARKRLRWGGHSHNDRRIVLSSELLVLTRLYEVGQWVENVDFPAKNQACLSVLVPELLLIGLAHSVFSPLDRLHAMCKPYNGICIRVDGPMTNTLFLEVNS